MTIIHQRPRQRVPQSSMLELLLFNIFINDLQHLDLNGKISMYADDICMLILPIQT